MMYEKIFIFTSMPLWFYDDPFNGRRGAWWKLGISLYGRPVIPKPLNSVLQTDLKIRCVPFGGVLRQSEFGRLSAARLANQRLGHTLGIPVRATM